MSNPENPDNRREIDQWETVAVTPMPPGWRNVYRLDDGTLTERPCPAVLVQENRGKHHSWDQPGRDAPFVRRSRFEPAEPPYDTRAVFADYDCGYLDVAADSPDHIGTAAPGQTADEVATE